GSPSTQQATSGIVVATNSASTGAPTSCDAGPDEDSDGDGVTVAQGDCNDCDANVNPNAIEVAITEPDPDTGEIPEPADEDCDGIVDNVPVANCDQGINLLSSNATDGARAIELRQAAPQTGGYGVVSAAYMRASGQPIATSMQFGIQ